MAGDEDYLRPRRSRRPPQVPDISNEDAFGEVVRKLSFFFLDAVDRPQTIEQLQDFRRLDPLIDHLATGTQYHAVVSALLALRGYFADTDSDDKPGLNDTRGLACELVAWRFVAQLSERDVLDYLTYELPPKTPATPAEVDPEDGNVQVPPATSRPVDNLDEHSPLLSHARSLAHRRTTSMGQSLEASFFGSDLMEGPQPQESDDFNTAYEGLTALEVAAVTQSKRFLSQKKIQKVINGIWKGDIIFWETVSVNSVKKARIYSQKRSDPYARLRVPRYLKAFEVVFFAGLLALYYGVLVQRNFNSISTTEIFLYIFLAGFAYDEFGEYRDAGQTFYATDFWTLWDLCIVLVGAAFCILRIVGLAKGSDSLIDTSFDVLSLEALFLVPRIFSLLSLNSYYGTLIPCLKEMTKDFIKFLSLIVILYLGFLTTFTLLARDQFTLRHMFWVLINVFFGSSSLGLDISHKISPYLGPPLMVIFVCMTNILLITSLISLLSNSLTKVYDHAREEYLFVYSVYVLEASTSNRLTYYMPPLNLLPLFCLRPLRLFVSSENLRRARIVLLKVTHFPYVAAIWAYEHGQGVWQRRDVEDRTALALLGGPQNTRSPRRRRGRPSLHPTGHRSSGSHFEHAAEETPRRGTSPAGMDGSHDDLKVLVLKLSDRIDALTAKIEHRDEWRQ